MPSFLSAEELLGGLLPLGDPIITGIFGLVTVLLGWVFGRRKQRQEIDNLQAEKKSIEAASGVSQAEAAQIIAQAAAETVRPLLERLQELREENARLDDEILHLNTSVRNLRIENEELRTHSAKLAVENKLMREKFKLQGDIVPELPPEVRYHDGLR
jgi:predicted nuclease with TOPRIM domain